MPVEEIRAESELSPSSGKKLLVVHFYAEWSDECSHMTSVLNEMSIQPEYEIVSFKQIKAETFPRVSLKYKVSAVPTFVFVSNDKEIGRLEGANVLALQEKVKTLVKNIAECPGVHGNETLDQRLKALVRKADVMVFIKGTRNTPRCGFTRQILSILEEEKIDFETFDILEDEAVRQGLKTLFDWPTYPQLYVKGNLVGGLDIIKQLKEAGELASTLQGN